MFAGRPEEVAQPLASQGIGSDSVKIAFAPMADQPRLSFVMELRVEVAAPVEVGDVPGGRRRIVAIAGGTFDGPSIRGRIVPGGADWQLIRPDGVAELDARYVLETDAGQVVYIRNRGLRHAAPEMRGNCWPGGRSIPHSCISAPRRSSRRRPRSSSGSHGPSSSATRTAIPIWSSCASGAWSEPTGTAAPA